jgi:hypothetical protein
MHTQKQHGSKHASPSVSATTSSLLQRRGVQSTSLHRTAAPLASRCASDSKGFPTITAGACLQQERMSLTPVFQKVQESHDQHVQADSVSHQSPAL